MANSRERLQLFQSKLADAKIECAVVGPTTHMRYLLGGSPHADERLCLLLVTPETVQMITPELNADSIAGFTDVQMITWTDRDGPGEALGQSVLTQALRSGGERAVFAVDGSMRADFLLSVLDFLEDERGGKGEGCAERIRVVSADPLVAELRIAKSPAEIEAIADAAAQADRAMQAAVDACKPGVTEADVAWVTEQAFRLDGAERVEFTLIAAGANAAQPHHHSGQKVLQKGEGIIIDIGASLNGYKSDITRVVFLGNPDKEFLAAYDTVRKANEAGKRTVRPGVTARDVDRATRRVIDNAGLGDYFIHRTGHGLGLDVHESPWIQEGSERVLQPGMVFSVEPGVYIQGGYGIRVEDIVTVTENGVRTLTGFDHELVIKEI